MALVLHKLELVFERTDLYCFKGKLTAKLVHIFMFSMLINICKNFDSINKEEFTTNFFVAYMAAILKTCGFKVTLAKQDTRTREEPIQNT